MDAIKNELLVTWIAPAIDAQAPLAWLNELGRIQKIIGVNVLTLTGNTVCLDDVAAVLRNPADVVIWSGHGTAGGLLLSDNKTMVRTKWLAAQVNRGGRTKVMILAACGSQLRDKGLKSLTEAICRGGTNVIGFPALAEDEAAGTFTVECVRALSTNTSIVQAFDVALESIADRDTAAGVFLTPGIRDMPFNLEDELMAITDALKRIESVFASRATVEPQPAENIERSSDTDSQGGIQSLMRGAKTSVAPKPGHIRSIGEDE